MREERILRAGAGSAQADKATPGKVDRAADTDQRRHKDQHREAYLLVEAGGPTVRRKITQINKPKMQEIIVFVRKNR